VCNKILNAELEETNILLTKWNSIKRKTTPGQPNPGYLLFRRQS
jgi:hypothetical protein